MDVYNELLHRTILHAHGVISNRTFVGPQESVQSKSKSAFLGRCQHSKIIRSHSIVMMFQVDQDREVLGFSVGSQ